MKQSHPSRIPLLPSLSAKANHSSEDIYLPVQLYFTLKYPKLMSFVSARHTDIFQFVKA